MLYGVVEWLKELTIFMVICETILSFAPNATYKKYIKPFVGLILLLWITTFFFGAVEIDWNQRINDIFRDYEQSVSQYLEHMPVVDTEEAYNAGTEKLNGNSINIEPVVIDPIEIGGTE